MQSIDDLARTITELDPSDQQALLERVAKLNSQRDRDNGADARFEVMQEAMNDELFLADLREVMEDSITYVHESHSAPAGRKFF